MSTENRCNHAFAVMTDGAVKTFRCADCVAEGRRAERAQVVTYTRALADTADKQCMSWPLVKALLVKMANDFESGSHISAAKTDDPHLGAAGKGGA